MHYARPVAPPNRLAAPTRRRPVLLASTLVVIAGCTPEPITSQGDQVSGLYNLFGVAAVVIFVVVAGLIGWSLIRYRARPGDEELPSQFHTNLGLEITWFAIPQVIVIGLFIATAIVLNNVNEEADDPAVTVAVEAFQWGWRFEYGGTDVSITGIPQDPAQIVLPAGQPITFVLNSEDVVHAFYIPRFLTKRDVIPGKENRFSVTIEEEGTYRGHCAEFCGLLHDQMPFTVEVVSVDSFESWLQQRGDEDGNG